MHLNTKALRDYTVSLIELIPKIVAEESNSNLGNYILVYISSCLAGRGYPTGNIEDDLIMTVKHEVLRCLTVIHSKVAAENELSYPYLRILLNFDTRETLNVISLAFQEREFTGDLGLLHRQRIVNILLEIFSPDQASWTQIGCLMNFIANQLAIKCLPEEKFLLEKVMAYLTSTEVGAESSREHSERENAWLELLGTDYLDHISNHELVRMAKDAHCFRVVEFLLEKNRNYDEILECYLRDKTRHSEMFAYLARFARYPEREIYSQIYFNLRKLLDINSDALVKVIVDDFPEEIHKFTKLLDKTPQEQHSLMDNLTQRGVTFEIADAEHFLDLMCQFQPQNVEPFLRNPVNKYRLEVALKTSKKYHLHSACVLLYEKQGDYQSAFNVSLDLLKEAPESQAEASAAQISALCARASDVLSENEREILWFTLLKLVLSRDLPTVTKSILHMASSHVDLSKLVQLVLTSGTKTGNFGDIRHLLVGMLSNSRYETVLLETTARVLGTDLHRTLAKEKKEASCGLAIPSVVCVECGHGLRKIGKEVVVFGTCGHAVHQECFSEVKGDSSQVSCPRCHIMIRSDNPMKLTSPKVEPFHEHITNSDHLQLSAPPRV